MRDIGRFFGIGKDRTAEDKTDAIRRIWERIGTMAGNGKSTTFNVERIDPKHLPPELKDWDYLKGLPDSFEVSIENNVGRLITLTSGTRYKELSMRSPISVPVYKEGQIGEGGKIPFVTESPRDTLAFADKFTMFVDHQREHARTSS